MSTNLVYQSTKTKITRYRIQQTVIWDEFGTVPKLHSRYVSADVIHVPWLDTSYW